jgi:serine/threonine-protein kinase RsbW
VSGDVIRLQIPARPDYILAVRLAVSAVAQRVGFDIENIEDLKVASAEACTLLLAGCPRQIDISLAIEDGLVMNFEASDFAAGAVNTGKSDGMSQYLLDALVDTCEIKDDGGVVHSVRLIKTL